MHSYWEWERRGRRQWTGMVLFTELPTVWVQFEATQRKMQQQMEEVTAFKNELALLGEMDGA